MILLFGYLLLKISRTTSRNSLTEYHENILLIVKMATHVVIAIPADGPFSLAKAVQQISWNHFISIVFNVLLLLGILLSCYLKN